MGNGAKPDDLGPATVIEQHRAPKNSDAELEQLYRDFAAENLNPLWTQLGDLMPQTPGHKPCPIYDAGTSCIRWPSAPEI